MTKQWYRVATLVAGTALIVLACAPDAPLQLVPDTPAHTPATLAPLPVSQRYLQARIDPNSVGNRHNAGLDSILSRGKRLRRAKGGMRLTRRETCELIAEVAVEHMTPLEFERVTVYRERPDSPCDRGQLAATATARLGDRMASSTGSTTVDKYVAAAEVMDWIDSMWLDDAEWEGSDAYPSFDDDIAFLDQWESAIGQTLLGSSGLASFESAMSTLVATAQVHDSVHVASLAEMAALAVSSAQYWNANLGEWIETFCPEREPGGGGLGDMRASAAQASELDVCDGGSEAMRLEASMSDWGWQEAAFVASADAK